MQLHVTSLPGGRLGAAAYELVDWLAAAGQSWWQVLPLGPPDRDRSPYKAQSAFAGWRELLAAPRARVSRAEIDEFRQRNAYWITGWEQFSSAGASGRPITGADRHAGTDAVADQVRFEREWTALRSYAAQRGVRLMGDVAIYVAPHSADHQAHPELFQEGFVSGAPPDAFAPKGQLWGNPLYDWEELRRQGYRWWVERLRRTLSLFDLARIDHFRGFVAYWSIPAGDRDATNGRWRRGPGRAVFEAVFRQLGEPLPLVAEDLGVITPAVERLRDELALPGMLVLQFGFDPRHPHSPHRPRNHIENRIIYTGTHDHDTTRGWYESLDDQVRRRVDAELSSRGIADPEPSWRLIRLALASPARVAIIPAQDLLNLGSEARMNNPARVSGNWRWQLARGSLTRSLAARLRRATEAAGRLR